MVIESPAKRIDMPVEPNSLSICNQDSEFLIKIGYKM
jgi:hypothetical protein